MTVASAKQSTRIWASLIVLSAIAGCVFGYVSVPSIQILAEPEKPVHKADLVERVAALAKAEGFVPESPDLVDSDRYSKIQPAENIIVPWVSAEDAEHNYSLWLHWQPRYSSHTEWIKFSIKRRNSTKPFELEDWQYFTLWYEELIPSLFENADINVVIHPIRFTDDENEEKFYEATGFPRWEGSKYQDPDDALFENRAKARARDAEKQEANVDSGGKATGTE